MSRINWRPILTIALAVAADLAIVANLAVPVRAPLVLGFLLIGPGMAFIGLLRIRRISAELTLALALSLSLDALVAEGMILARIWSAGMALAVLIALAVAGALMQMLRSTDGSPQHGQSTIGARMGAIDRAPIEGADQYNSERI